MIEQGDKGAMWRRLGQLEAHCHFVTGPSMHPLESYLRDVHDIRSTGVAVKETSYYPSLANLLDAVDQKRKPRVRCVINSKNQGAGMPDGGPGSNGNRCKRCMHCKRCSSLQLRCKGVWAQLCNARSGFSSVVAG